MFYTIFYRYIFLLACLLLFPLILFPQSETIKRTLENLSENQDIQLDYSELIEELETLENNPINLNSNQIEQLHRLFLLNEFQLENLKSYILKNNELLSVYELLLIDGFTRENIESLLPFIEVKPVEKQSIPSLKQLAKYSKQDAFFRYQRVLETQKGFLDYEDGSNVNSYYLGNADKYYIKYKLSTSNKFQMGFTAEKDAGELFLSDSKNLPPQTDPETHFKKGFDYTSLHFYGQDLGVIKQIAIGDYHLRFGQGLTLWTGLSFGKSADAIQLKKFESFIKPNTSSGENGFLRGASIHLGKKKWSVILFYSKNKQDATLKEDENGNEYVSTLLFTGLHRTLLELNKKHSIDIQLIGGRFKYIFNTMSIGFTAFQTDLSKEIISDATPDNLFDFNGNRLANYGLDYAFRWWKAHFFGEIAKSSTGGAALISGVMLPIHSRLNLSLLYRNYEKNYQNIFSSALAENSQTNNEKGFFAGAYILLNKKMRLQAYADFFTFPWLKYEQDSPSKGVEYRTQLFYDYKPTIKMHLKFKYKQKQINTKAENLGEVNYLLNETRTGGQFQINYFLNDQFELRNRIEITSYSKENQAKQFGYMIYQDINYHSVNQRFVSNTRFAIFNTDSYASAIYAYENDVLYAFSIPAYFGQGIRFYQLINYDLNQHLNLWFRYSLSYYPNEESIGSGLDEINRNLKSEIKFQLRIKI